MTSALDLDAVSAPRLAPRTRERLVAVAPSLWRVLEPGGRVIGHLQQIPQPDGVRFRARRFHPSSQAFRDLGEFWNPDDAVECLRFAR